MTDEEHRRITEVKPHKGSRLPPGRHVHAGELTALGRSVRAIARRLGHGTRRCWPASMSEVCAAPN